MCTVIAGRSRDRFPVMSPDFSVTYSFRPYHGPGVDSAPSENEYQEHSLGAKSGRCVRLTPSPLSCAECHGKFGSLNLLEPSGPHRACYGTDLALLLPQGVNPIAV